MSIGLDPVEVVLLLAAGVAMAVVSNLPLYPQNYLLVLL